MEARIGGENHQFYGIGPSSFNALGRGGVEWNPNEWRWDGDLFLASPLSAAPSDCRNKQLPLVVVDGGASNSTSSCSEDTDFRIIGKGKRRMDASGNDYKCDEPESLALNLGQNVYPFLEAELANWDANNGKRTKVLGFNPNRLLCQVEGCGADLSDARDYHRRHKVCEMHAKATSAVVGSVVQRFCQQCSRFHLLQEFDEGKRSCRRRLAGHNRRRRKTHPESSTNVQAMPDDKTSSYLLISLLRILTNIHADGSDKSSDQDLLSHLVRNLSSLVGPSNSTNFSRLLQTTQDTHKVDTRTSETLEAPNHLLLNGNHVRESMNTICVPSTVACGMVGQNVSVKHIGLPGSVTCTSGDLPSKRNIIGPSLCGQAVSTQVVSSAVPGEENFTKTVAYNASSFQQMFPAPCTIQRLNDFDLNDAYDESEDCIGKQGEAAVPASLGTGSTNFQSWLHQDSHHSCPPQNSGNSDSTSTQSLSNSNGDAQSRTDRIVLKLFGKDPSDFPITLRVQILDWLSHSPTDMESYIRPGCIILTIYLRLTETAWEQLSDNLSFRLNKLLQSSESEFWRRGWIYARVRHQIAFIFNGHVVLSRRLLAPTSNHLSPLCIVPIAVSISASVDFTVKGLKFAQSIGRILCAFEGKYLHQETKQDSSEGGYGFDSFGNRSCNFSCVLPNTMGRGFIEIEDSGLGSIFFPFVVAEEDVCSEIRMLEKEIDMDPYDDQAMNFLHEFGWLLRRAHMKSRHTEVTSFTKGFSLRRFRRLVSFSIDRDWCVVVRKLLDFLFEGHVDIGGFSLDELVSSECLLHDAVRKKCRPLVEMLLRYIPCSSEKEPVYYLFRPDMPGPLNVTPLHIASTISGSEGIVDALTDDPKQLGINAWRTARDASGFTPEEYACSRGYYSYVGLVDTKTTKRSKDRETVIVDIPPPNTPPVSKLASLSSKKPVNFHIDTKKDVSPSPSPSPPSFCKTCIQQQAVRCKPVQRSLLYRPAMLSLVCIAAVCVCVALFLKTPPAVECMEGPFSWDALGSGAI